MKSILNHRSYLLLAGSLLVGSLAHASCPDLSGTYAVAGGSNPLITQSAADAEGYVNYTIFGDEFRAKTDGSLVIQKDKFGTAQCLSDRVMKSFVGAPKGYHSDEVRTSTGVIDDEQHIYDAQHGSDSILSAGKAIPRAEKPVDAAK
jgi:hypothetical protein